MERCIVLNGDYTFLNTIDWKRAVCLVIKGKSEVVKYSETILHTAGGAIMKLPIVIRLIKIIRSIYKSHVPFTIKNVMVRDRYLCVYCKSKNDLTIDHVIPASRGGKSSFENCVASCRPCNNKKGSRTPREAKMFLKKQPYAPTISEFFKIKMDQLGMYKLLKDLGVY